MPAKKSVKIQCNGQMPENGILKAKIPPSITGPRIAFTHRHLANISTGLTVKAEKGHQVCFALVSSLSSRGMVATNAPGNVVDGEIVVTLLNCGREIVDVKDGDPIVRVWVTQITDAEWESQ